MKTSLCGWDEPTLREALAICFRPRRATRTADFVILKPTEHLRNIEFALLAQSVVPDWAFDDVELNDPNKRSRRNCWQPCPKRLDRTVSEAMKQVQSFAQTDRLPKLIQLMQSRELHCLPVLDKDRVAGILYLNDVFRAAAHLALTAQSANT
jgi:hypothetical protein